MLKYIAFICCLVINICCFAQGDTSPKTANENSRFEKYVVQRGKWNDISISKPKDMDEYPLQNYYPFSTNAAYIRKTKYNSNGLNDGKGGFWYEAIFQSKKKDCIFMYPLFVDVIPQYPGQIQEDIAYAAEDELMDVRPFLKFIDKKEGIYISNADYAIIYEFKTPVKHFELYDNFVGIYLRKQGHGCLLLKMGLTEEGLKHKDEYIKKFLNSIKYGDTIIKKDDNHPSDDYLRFDPPTQLRPKIIPGSEYIQ